MKILLKMIIALVCGGFLGFVVLYGIDRECARRDYENGLESVGCVFESNCKFYNNQMKGEFFMG